MLETDRIIVTRRLHKNTVGNPEWIYVKDIFRSVPERIKGENKIVITTYDGIEYFYATTSDAIIEVLSKENGFVIVDRGRIVNLNHDVDIDYENGIIRLAKQGINVFIGIARSRIDDVKRFFSDK
ncbi:hypothetical protein D3C73_278600 [compost metagenome]